MSNQILDGTYIDKDFNFVGVVNGEVRFRYGGISNVISGVNAVCTVKIDESGMIQGNLPKPKKKKWGVWNHEVSVRDNLALIERGHGLVGFTIDGKPACMYFGMDGVFKVNTSFWGVTSVSVSGLTETLAGRVGEFNGF